MKYAYDAEGSLVGTHEEPQKQGTYTRIIADPYSGRPIEVQYRPQSYDAAVPSRFRPDDGRGFSSGRVNGQSLKSQADTHSRLDEWGGETLWNSPLYEG